MTQSCKFLLYISHVAAIMNCPFNTTQDHDKIQSTEPDNDNLVTGAQGRSRTDDKQKPKIDGTDDANANNNGKYY